MAEGEGVIESTVAEAKAHPVLIIGGLVAVVALLWIVSSGSTKANKGQNFSFSYGPSDAQIAAGTAQQIATQQAQTAVSLANINAGTTSTVAQDYFGYLANHSADTLTATLNGNATAAQIAGINTQAQVTINGQNNNTAVTQSNNLLTGLINTNQTTSANDMNGNATALAIATNTNATAAQIAAGHDASGLAAILSNNQTSITNQGLATSTAYAIDHDNNATSLAALYANNATTLAVNSANNATTVSVANTNASSAAQLAYQNASLQEYLANAAAYNNTVNQSTIQGAIMTGLLPAGYSR